MSVLEVLGFSEGMVSIGAVSHSSESDIYLCLTDGQIKVRNILLIEGSIFVKNKDRTKRRNVLFNDAPNTFYLWLYGVSVEIENTFWQKEGD